MAIPTFHCPRCRDHWYGLTAYPCDEELARLMRDGLWYTGKEAGSKTGNSRDSARNRKLNSAKKEFGGLSSESLLAADMKGQRRKPGQDSSSRDPFSIGEDESKRKNKKRITFKLDSDEGSGHAGGRKGEEDDPFGSNLGSRSRTDGGSMTDGGSGGDKFGRDSLSGDSKDGIGLRGVEDGGDLSSLGKLGRRNDGKGLETTDGLGSDYHSKGQSSEGKDGQGLLSGSDEHQRNSTGEVGRGRLQNGSHRSGELGGMGLGMGLDKESDETSSHTSLTTGDGQQSRFTTGKELTK